MTLVAKHATRTIPIVTVYVGDPIASGSRHQSGSAGSERHGVLDARPRDGPEGARVAQGGSPSISRVAVLIDSANRGQFLPDAATGKALGDQVRAGRPFRKSADLDAALATVLRERADALFVSASAIVAAM